MLLLQHVLTLVAAQRCTALVLNTLKSASVLNPSTGTTTPLLEGLATSRNVVVLLPQVGEFDSYEFCEQLTAVADDLKAIHQIFMMLNVQMNHSLET